MSTRVPQPQNDRIQRFVNRGFSEFSLQHNVYCVPVDQVRQVVFEISTGASVLICVHADHNSQAEQQRVEELDGILHELFSGRTVFPPFPPPKGDDESESPPTVLDCGFSQGAWIQHFMDEFGEDCRC